MHILQELLSIGNHTRITISTDPIMNDLMNTILMYLKKTITHIDIYYFNKTYNGLLTFCIY